MALNDVAGIEAGQHDFGRSLRKELKDTWLSFADGYLRNSGNEFLEGFAAYLKKGYKDAEQNDYVFIEPDWATKHQALLKEMLDFEAVRFSSMQNKGFALTGKTSFDKLEFIKHYFEARGLFESVGKNKDGHFVVIDCSKIKRYAGFIKVLEKNKDIPYVIFNNCEDILKKDDIIRVFAHIADKNEYCDNELNTSSFYVFIENENTIPNVGNFPVGSSIADHIGSFCTFIHVYDFDKGRRYFG